jgi:hypothetical protein
MRRHCHLTLAERFLYHTLELALVKFSFGRNHPFVQVILGLRNIEQIDPNMLQGIIFEAYWHCIHQMRKKLTSHHLTTLTLWSDFVVYLDNSSARDAREALNSFQREVQKSLKVNGVDGDDDNIFEILGLLLYVLQSNKSTVGEAKMVAEDMLRRVHGRLEAGEKLEGKLLMLWRDLKNTLSRLCHQNGEFLMAVTHLEDYLKSGVKDDRDTESLQRLEDCYTQLGQLDQAQRVLQWRMRCSLILLGDEDSKTPETETDLNRDHVINEDDDTGNGTSDNIETSKRNLEDDDTREIEIQTIQEQQDELEKRNRKLERRNRKLEKMNSKLEKKNSKLERRNRELEKRKRILKMNVEKGKGKDIISSVK